MANERLDQQKKSTTKENSRNFDNRRISKNLPKPNIVRIEILDGNARKRYLGQLQAMGDTVRSTIYDTLIKTDNDKVFYGFIRKTGRQNISIAPQWGITGGSGGLLGTMKGIASESSNIARNALKAAEGIADSARALTGMNISTTGSTTLRRFSGVNLNDLSIDCGWYLPEQLRLCAKSLQVLTRMSYPVQSSENALHNELPQMIESVNEQIRKDLQEFGQISESVQRTGTAVMNVLFSRDGKGYIKTGQTFMKGLKVFNRLFGKNLTFDPLPVRLTVGQYMDIEPLIIKSMAVNFSKEMFISNDGLHVPIFCYVSIGFGFWLTPAPKQEFMSLIGQEMFGQNVIDPPIDESYKKALRESKEVKEIQRNLAKGE